MYLNCARDPDEKIYKIEILENCIYNLHHLQKRYSFLSFSDVFQFFNPLLLCFTALLILSLKVDDLCVLGKKLLELTIIINSSSHNIALSYRDNKSCTPETPCIELYEYTIYGIYKEELQSALEYVDSHRVTNVSMQFLRNRHI